MGIKGVDRTAIGVHRTGLGVHRTGHIKKETSHTDDTKHHTVVVNTQYSNLNCQVICRSNIPNNNFLHMDPVLTQRNLS